jgi:hypothetical protein
MKLMPEWRALLVVAVLALGASSAWAQPEDEPEVDPPTGAGPTGGTAPLADSWKGAVRVLRVPGAGATGAAEARAAAEIFPESSKVWMQVHGTDPRPVEGARRGARKWVCSAGCELALPGDDPNGAPVDTRSDDMLVSIKVQTPTQPLPLTIWRPRNGGELLFDASLLGRRSYRHVCAYPPVKDAAQPGDRVPPCPQRPASVPTPDSGEMRLGFLWPQTSELAAFEYIAVTDTCGNARVQPFQRSFTVPVYHVASGGCGAPDGRVLRVFPSGGWVRITAFNLDAPAAGSVVSATFRVSVPPLEDLVSDAQPRLLFPDPRMDELTIDCGPVVLKAQPGPAGVPRRAPGERPGQTAPPGMALPGQTAPPGKKLPGQAPPPGRETPPDKNAGGKDGRGIPPVVRKARIIPASSPSGQPMANQGLVIAPEPLFRGNCRVEMHGQTKRRLVAPLALRMRIIRTDKPGDNILLDRPWIVTPTDATFHIPPMDPGKMDGESRLRVEVYSDPKSTQGNVILLSDAGRVARGPDTLSDQGWNRLIGSVTIHSAPLCGDSNFETVEGVGSCLRGYFTVPAMLATLQITRAPWLERPLITRKIFNAVGVAFAFDSYDPVERRAFPVAGQIGGFVQDLGDDRIGLLGYVGVAPTIPILGEGGNTTSIGLLGGIGMEYISDANGPDEGFKPAAFLSIVVQVGQANPALHDYSGVSSYQAPPPTYSDPYPTY